VIDTNALYKEWQKKYKPLFESLNMGRELNKILEAEKVSLEQINEVFMKDLVKNADTARKLRSKSPNIKVFYKGVAKTKGWLIFNATSQYTPGKKYYQYIKLLDTKDIKHLKDFTNKDIVRLLLSGNIACFCSCPDHLYRGFKYMGDQMGYGIQKEKRYPRIRNPRLEGTVCKHMLAVFSVLMANWLSISRDLPNSYYWKNRYGKEDS
jgi:hypothetical protein